jgi:hypothetical protein
VFHNLILKIRPFWSAPYSYRANQNGQIDASSSGPLEKHIKGVSSFQYQWLIITGISISTEIKTSMQLVQNFLH